MVSQKGEQSILEQFFISIYQKTLAEKDIEIPKYSYGVLEKIFNKSFDQAIKVRQIAPNFSANTVLMSIFMTEIESLRKNNDVIILLSKHRACFTSGKKSPYSISVVQPNIPETHQCKEKITQYGKIVVIKAEEMDDIKRELTTIMDKLREIDADFVCFPELFFADKIEFDELFSKIAVEKNCFIVAGSFHDEKQKSNTSKTFLPNGKIVKQNKIFRAPDEGIEEKPIEFLEIVDFGESSFCVLICLDSEREPIREILKERLEVGDCPVLIFNPSNTDHPSRSIGILTNNLMILLSTVIVFCNAKQRGGSTILVPLVKLKDKRFELFCMNPCEETSVEVAEVDLNLLLTNRRKRQREVISMIK